MSNFNPNYKGSRFNSPRVIAERIVVADNLVTKADKNNGLKNLTKTLSDEGLSPYEIETIVGHEKKHTDRSRKPGTLGIYKNEEGKIVGAFYREIGESSDETKMDVAAAGGELFTHKGEGDTAIWLRALHGSAEREG